MTDYRPTSGKAEIHCTYRCSLSCRFCNRNSFLREAHTIDLSVEDLVDFLNQARDIGYYPGILIIGGEPTLHPDFETICAMCREFADEGVRFAEDLVGQKADRGEAFRSAVWTAAKGDNALRYGIGYPAKRGLLGMVQLWSNQTTEESRLACERVRKKYHVSVVAATIKQRNPVTGIDTIPVQYGQKGDQSERYEFDVQDTCVSPWDLGYGLRPHCWQHGAEICGISVDAGGYTLCATGGSIAGVLGIETFRTKVLADLFDQEKAAYMTGEMCRHCGSCLSKTGISNVVDPETWKARVAELPKWNGMPVSPTWEEAFRGRK